MSQIKNINQLDEHDKYKLERVIREESFSQSDNFIELVVKLE
jgi:hypothetical protein